MKPIKIFSIAFVFSMLLFSCSDDDKIDINPERIITNEETQNNQNEHDRFGRLHNVYLDFFIARDDFQDGVNRDYLLQITREFYVQNDLDYNQDELITSLNIFNEMQASGIELESALESPGICDYIPIFCDNGNTGPFNPYPIPDFTFITSGNNTDKVLDFIERTKRLENEIVKSDDYSDEQKTIILQYNAVARYSHQYWHNQEVMGNQSPWDDYMDDTIILASDCPTCKADFVGAATGALGGPGGALGGAALASAGSIIAGWIWD